MSTTETASLTPEAILAALSQVSTTQPAQALIEADQHRDVLTDKLIEALEHGLADPEKNFEQEGILFNHASYLLAKWRERRAGPYFIRWFSLPGEGALDLGSDTIVRDGGRLLASVCGEQVAGLQELVRNPQAHELCRGEALKALAILAAWNELPKNDVESFYLFLAREGLERKPNQLWDKLASLSGSIEALSVFPELRRAYAENLINTQLLPPAALDQEETRERGVTFRLWAASHPPITDVVAETAGWSGYHMVAEQPPQSRIISRGQTYFAPTKVGRNDPCPCGSGQKFKKCCGRAV